MMISVEVPQEVFDRAVEIARSQRMSVPEVFSAACSRHVANWGQLEARSRRGDREKFQDVLARVPDLDPLEQDRFE